jgi:hypothetical protein
VPAQEVLSTKQRYVAQVNNYVGRKKEADRSLKAKIADRDAAMPSTSSPAGGDANPFGNHLGAAMSPSVGPPAQKQVRGAYLRAALTRWAVLALRMSCMLLSSNTC